VNAFVDVFGYIAADVISEYGDGYYYYGHPSEIVNTLSQKSQNDTLKFQKFPMIGLFQDFSERYEDLVWTVENCTVILAQQTKPTYKASERYTNTFKAVLYPMYEQLITSMNNSKYIQWDKNHVKIDRVYWGKEGLYGNTGNIFNDYIDAIEIKFNEIQINKFCNYG